MTLLDITPNQPSKFRTKKLDEMNDDWRGMYNTNRQIKVKFVCEGKVKFINLLVKGAMTG